MTEKSQIGRLAMRQEGHLWAAYYAKLDTMQGAIFLGSIQMAAVAGNPARKNRFMGLMQDFVADILRDVVTADADEISWNDPQPAPQHERAGRA